MGRDVLLGGRTEALEAPPVRHRAAARRLEIGALDASDGARPDATADDPSALPDAAAGKLADQEPDDPELGAEH